MSLLDPSAYNFLGLTLVVLAAAAGIIFGSARTLRNFALGLVIVVVCALWVWHAATRLHPGEEQQWLVLYALAYGVIYVFSWVGTTLVVAIARRRRQL